MNAKKLILVILSFSILLSLNSWAATKKITRLGRYSFARVSADVPAQDVMKLLAERYAVDIKFGFDQAGYPALVEPFLDKLRSADFIEKSIPVGAVILWMLFREGGRVMVWKDLEWAGKAPVDVYSITVVQADKEYEFIIPKPCGNIALYMVTQKNTIPLTSEFYGRRANILKIVHGEPSEARPIGSYGFWSYRRGSFSPSILRGSSM